MENMYEIIKCSHGEPCYIKTGLNNPATYLKSFYVCSTGKCSFQKLLTIKPMKCIKHPEKFVGLIKPFVDDSSDEMKINYRCSMHDKAKKWCGSMLLQPNKNASVEFSSNISIQAPILSDYNDKYRVEKKEIIDDEKFEENLLKSGARADKETPIGSDQNTNTVHIEHLDTSGYDAYFKKYSVSELQADIAAQKNLLTSLNLKKLPDGGDKIRIMVEKMTKALKCLQLGNIDKKTEDNIDLDDSCGTFTHEGSLKYPTKIQTYSDQSKPLLSVLHLREQKGDAISEAINRLHLQKKSCPSSTTGMDTPLGLTVDLMLHQKQALAWLMWRELQNPKGGILGDDMGLGKTLTMISLILKLKETCTEISQESEWFDKSKFPNPSKSSLIVCPASLIHQWQSEIEKRVMPGHLTVYVYHGPNRKDSINKLLRADIVLTTYNIVSLEVGIGNKKTSIDESCHKNVETGELKQSCSSPILQIHWQRIILDEGHIIKNHRSVTALSTCRLKAEIRWILSGTPIHNDISDVYSLLRFLRCSPFDDFKVWKRHVDNKSKNGEDKLNLIVKVLMLRRTKDQKCAITGISLVSLPEKKCNIHYIILSKEEHEIYEMIFVKSKSKVQEYLKEQEEIERKKLMTRKAISGVDKKAEHKMNNATQMLLMLLRLRQSCCHPYLMKEAAEVDDFRFELEIDVEEQIKSLNLESPGNVGYLTNHFMMETSSTKIKHLIETMEKVRQECTVSGVNIKSVIVSQWTKMLDIVRHHLTMINYRCCTIKGDIPAVKRSEIIDNFNLDPNGPEVMLLSLRAGGTGLNLVGGSHLYIVDMHWNPALEQQACDRIYRVGQEKNVTIHKFVCKDTIEEKIVQLQEKKMSLANQVLTGVARSSTKFCLEDIKDLFGMG